MTMLLASTTPVTESVTSMHAAAQLTRVLCSTLTSWVLSMKIPTPCPECSEVLSRMTLLRMVTFRGVSAPDPCATRMA